jgi:hypothetical protein
MADGLTDYVRDQDSLNLANRKGAKAQRDRKEMQWEIKGQL